MITLYRQTFEIYQVILMTYIVGYGVVLGVRNTFYRFLSWFTGTFRQSDLGKLLDSLWYGVIFILVGTLL